MATPAILYAAKSTADPNDSVGSQLDRIRQRLADEGDREIVGEFFEEGVSGYRRSRGPELEAAIRAAKAAAAERGGAELWIFHSSRIARGTGRMREARALGEVFYDLRRHGVELRSVEDDDLLRREEFIGMTSAMARKYSEDISAHVRRSKQRQMDRGERLGGPVPDGLLRHVERDPATDRVIARRYVRDPERAPIIERIFDLSEQGHGDGPIARTLNGQGIRTRGRRPWTRRRVQDTLLNPLYAGRVRRATANGVRLAEPEVVAASNVEALIEPDRFDRITAARARRDLGRGKHERGGRPTTRYALAKLGECDRCGSRLYTATSPYKRKDGTQARRYVCASVRDSNGACDAPPIDAAKVDAAIVSYLDGLFVDFEAWQAEIARGHETQRAVKDAEIRRATDRLEKVIRREALLRERWLEAMESGDQRAERQASEALEAVTEERDDLRARVERLEAERNADAATTADEMLDVFNDLAKAVRSGGGDSMATLNERLRAEFETFRLDTMPDGTVGVQPVLRAVPSKDWDVQRWLRDWIEAGRPMPSDDEARRIMREDAREDPLWITGEEKVRPPAKALTVVPSTMGPNSQEPWHLIPSSPASRRSTSANSKKPRPA